MSRPVSLNCQRDMPDTKVHSRRIVGAALAIALALAACDGGNGDESQSAPVGESALPAISGALAPGPPAAAPGGSAIDRGPAADRVAAVVAAAEAAEQLSQCARGIKFLQERLDVFDGPTAEREVIRAGLNAALIAHAAAHTQTCLDAFADPLAVLGYEITPTRLEPVPCTRAIDGAILMLDEIGDNARTETQAFLDVAVAALERGDFDGCIIALSEALEIMREAQSGGE